MYESSLEANRPSLGESCAGGVFSKEYLTTRIAASGPEAEFGYSVTLISAKIHEKLWISIWTTKQVCRMRASEWETLPSLSVEGS